MQRHPFATITFPSQLQRAERHREVWQHARALAEPCRIGLRRHQILSVGGDARNKMNSSLPLVQ